METMERPRSGAGPFSSLIAYLLGDDVRRARAFFALSDLELDLLALVESRVAWSLDLWMMDKQILSTVIGVNEAKTFTWIEPLDCTCTHLYFSLADKPAD